jgi:hypothetical protein
MSRRAKRKRRKQQETQRKVLATEKPAECGAAAPEVGDVSDHKATPDHVTADAPSSRGALRVAADDADEAYAASRPGDVPVASSVTPTTVPVLGGHPIPHVTQEQIRQRAYEIYVARGGRSGSALNDWLQAERELGFQARTA